MFFAIYNDIENKITRYYYLKDRYIYYDEFSNQTTRTFKQNSLYNFYKMFCVPNNSKFLEGNNEYRIYLDDNGYKHYIKDGKEDFLQFFENNGTNCILYSSDGDKKNLQVKRFFFGGTLAAFSIICSMQLFNILQNNIIESYEGEQSKIICSYEVNYYDVIHAIEKIDTLPEEHKNKILNSDIIESLFPYYSQLQLNILTQIKLKGLAIQHFENEFDYIAPTVFGRYDPLNPSTIYLRNGTDDQSFCHEFAHLLQSDKHPLYYLTEPTAELMCHDFFGEKIDSYIDKVNILKLLICTIGPEPILKCSFGGDSSEILEILKNNLEPADYDVMVSSLSLIKLGLSKSEQETLQKLIERLYKNMYGTEMKDTLPGYDLIANQSKYSNVVDDRFYLNTSKIESEGNVSFSINSEMYDLIDKSIDIVSVEDINFYKKEISEEEYDLIYSNNASKYKTKVEFGSEVQPFDGNHVVYRNGRDLVVIKCGEEYVEILFQKAIDLGYVKFFITASEDKIDDNDGWLFDYQMKNVVGILPPITSVLSNSLDNIKSASR